MDAPFPAGLPTPTAFYLVLYVVTLAIHVAFMNYVLAGTGWLAIAHFGPWRNAKSPATKILNDWMPLMLSGAITAGIAPLLFVQILYQREFYTSNLLLFNRWMAILPVLIAGFYALYLLKSGWLARRGGWLIAAVAAVPLICISFTGYSWTENHLLSVRDPAFWGRFYGTNSQLYTEAQLVPRLAVWAFGSIPTFALLLAWQLWYHTASGAKTLGRVALVGLLLVSATACGYYFAADDRTRQAFVSPMALPYFVLACCGMAMQAFGWLFQLRSDTFEGKKLIIISLGLAATVTGMTVCREAVRIGTLGTERFESLFPKHQAAFGKSGFGIFLAFFILNAALIAFCFWLVRTKSKASTPPASSAHP